MVGTVSIVDTGDEEAITLPGGGGGGTVGKGHVIGDAPAMPALVRTTAARKAQRTSSLLEIIFVLLLVVKLCMQIVPQKLHSCYNKSNYFVMSENFLVIRRRNPQSTNGYSVEIPVVNWRRRLGSLRCDYLKQGRIRIELGERY
jgi:hypothetical protein